MSQERLLGIPLAIILVVLVGAVACEATGSSPERPLYVKCQP